MRTSHKKNHRLTPIVSTLTELSGKAISEVLISTLFLISVGASGANITKDAMDDGSAISSSENILLISLTATIGIATALLKRRNLYRLTQNKVASNPRAGEDRSSRTQPDFNRLLDSFERTSEMALSSAERNIAKALELLARSNQTKAYGVFTSSGEQHENTAPRIFGDESASVDVPELSTPVEMPRGRNRRMAFRYDINEQTDEILHNLSTGRQTSGKRMVT